MFATKIMILWEIIIPIKYQLNSEWIDLSKQSSLLLHLRRLFHHALSFHVVHVYVRRDGL